MTPLGRLRVKDKIKLSFLLFFVVKSVFFSQLSLVIVEFLGSTYLLLFLLFCPIIIFLLLCLSHIVLIIFHTLLWSAGPSS